MDYFWDLELELAKIADAHQMTRKDLINNFHELSLYTQESIRHILKEQIQLLKPTLYLVK